MTTRGKNWAGKVLAELHRVGRLHRGSIMRAEQAIEKSSGYLRRRRLEGTVELSKCLDFMAALGLHPARFFRRVFPFTGDEVSCHIDPPRGTPPKVIKRAYERLASADLPSIPRTHLVSLDALRYDRPAQAAQGVFDALPFIDPADVSFALGVWGSSQRWLLELDRATHAFFAGMEIASMQKGHCSFGDLLQRQASVAGDQRLVLGTGSDGLAFARGRYGCCGTHTGRSWRVAVLPRALP